MAQLNPFEIKSLLNRMLEQSAEELSVDDIQLLDEQPDKQIIVKLLYKEFYNLKTEEGSVLCFLLERYADREELIKRLWDLLRNNVVASNVKIVALNFLRGLDSNWTIDAEDEILTDDIIDAETAKLLNNAVINPEVQIDFLDFLSSVDDKDRLLLVQSLAEDYSQDALANVLVPVFISAPETDIGKEALNLLGNSKSQLAYHALNTVIDDVSEELKPLVRKNLNLLKLAGIREDNSHEFYVNLLSESKPYRCCATYPDGHGNQALIFSRKNINTKKVQFVAIVINDYTGIRDCFGFNEISEFECDKIIERFYKDEKNIPLSANVLKALIVRGEKISRKNSNWLLPYEYVCWKNLTVDIEPDTQDIKVLLENTFISEQVTLAQVNNLAKEDFMSYWFLDGHYSSEIEAFLEILDTEVLTDNCDFASLVNQYLNMVFYKDEFDIWKERVLLCSYMELNNKHKNTAQTLFNIYHDKTAYTEFLKLILRKSIYEHYFSLKFNTEENQNKFTLKQLDDIISTIEKKWVSNV